ncbi:MAG: DUF429 domain-containing protein [Bacteroidota bacterium]
MMHVGIDYGSKLAGTTVLCWEQDGQLHYQQSEKKKDADQWLIQLIQELSPPEVFIDAPLSLPAAYHGKGEDFFYRDCDRELRAMSPMFLGGLTARAMKLRHLLSPQQIVFQETYPAELVRNLPDLKECYLKKKAMRADFLDKLQQLLPHPIHTMPTNWHQADAILAWMSGWRHQQNKAKQIGRPEEGLIII